MNNNISYKLVSIAFGVITILFLCVFYAYAWTDPTAAPPEDNVPAPVNIGSTTQYKTGGLGVGAFTASAIRAGSPTGITTNGILSQGDICTNAGGGKCLSNLSSGGIGGSGTSDYIPKFTGGTTLGNSTIYDNGTNVGIGTTSPNYKLDVRNGDVNFQRSGPVGLEMRGIGSTPYIDFSNDESSDYDVRMILSDNNELTIDGGGLKIIDGTQGAGKVLTSDASGKATWQTSTLVGCQMCFKWAVTSGGNISQCNTADSGTRCAAIDSWTTGYIDDTDNKTGGCVLQWKIDCTAPYGD